MKLRHIGSHLLGVYRSLYFPPTVIFVAIIIATLFSWHAAVGSLSQDIQASTRNKAASTESVILNTLASYEEILRGGVGLFRGSDEVLKQDWTNYLSAFSAAQNYPDVQGFAYVGVYSAEQLPALTAYMHSQGVADFAVQPATPPRDQYAVMMYAEQVASKSLPVYGFDFYAYPERRQPMERARDSGQTAISGRLQLVSQDRSTPLTGFNMYVPYYASGLPINTVEERRAAHRGYTMSSFRTSVFFRPISLQTVSSGSGFKITAAGDTTGQPLYQTAHFASIRKKPDAIVVNRSVRLFGETWNMQYVFDRAEVVSQVQLRRPPSVLFGGIFVAFLIAIIVLLLLRSRARELAAQKEKAVELAKDELLSLASHQLRTPATGVKQYVGMVLQGFAGDITDEQQKLLEKAYASNDRQLQIINEILHLAKIGSGRIVLARQPTNLGELIRDIVAEQEPDIKSAQHTVRLESPKTPIVLNIDAHMLRMAIENLLSNAIKYTHRGGRITIKLYKNWRNVYVRVTDTGIGIAENDQQDLFKQFKRITNEMTQEVGGTGIGLFLAKSLVEQHSGDITVRSTPGQGSAFTIILPRENSEL